MEQDNKNYKVRCVGYKGSERYFTIGKVYDVVNDEITNDDGYTYHGCDDVIEFMSKWYNFEKVDNDSLISRVIFNGPATIILWEDGTKTIAKTHSDDAFDPEKGFAVACAKKLLGNRGAFRTELAKWIPVEDKRLNIEGFNVGDRVVWDSNIGTVIALSERGCIGVEFDRPGVGVHNCCGILIKAGHTGTKHNSRWLMPDDICRF